MLRGETFRSLPSRWFPTAQWVLVLEVIRPDSQQQWERYFWAYETLHIKTVDKFLPEGPIYTSGVA